MRTGPLALNHFECQGHYNQASPKRQAQPSALSPLECQEAAGCTGRDAGDAIGMMGAMLALNFYSPVVADQLRHRRKTATIRLGDKSTKYRKGIVVAVLSGQRFGVREKIFDAVIDKVEVKPLREVSPREIQHDNPEIRHIDEFVTFLGQLYNRQVSEDDTVTVIHFSEIRASQ